MLPKKPKASGRSAAGGQTRKPARKPFQMARRDGRERLTITLAPMKEAVINTSPAPAATAN